MIRIYLTTEELLKLFKKGKIRTYSSKSFGWIEVVLSNDSVVKEVLRELKNDKY